MSEKGFSLEFISQSITQMAIDKGSRDNCSVLIVDLNLTRESDMTFKENYNGSSRDQAFTVPTDDHMICDAETENFLEPFQKTNFSRR